MQLTGALVPIWKMGRGYPWRGGVIGRIPQRSVVAVIALASLALLVARSRPLARFVGGIEPLLYASDLTEPRALLSLPDGTIVLAEETDGGRRVVEVGVDGQSSPVAASDAPIEALGLGGAWAVAASGDGTYLATVPAEGKLVRVAPGGAAQTREIATFIGPDGVNPMPTGVAVAPDGTVYVALFATTPDRAGSGKVARVGPDGRWAVAFDTLSFPTGLGFDGQGQLYVVELAQRFDARAGAPTAGTGRVMAIGPQRYQRRTLLRDLALPAGLVFTPAGDLYLSENAYHAAARGARILRVPAQGLRPPG